LGLGDWTVPDRYRGKLVTARVRYFPRKLLALTFDDGPDPTVTPQVLKILAAYRAHATFFVIGENAKGHPELLRQEVAAAHAVGSHSYHHIYKATAAQAESNLDQAAAVIEQATDRRPTLFRPPGGFTEGALARLARRQGYAVILWTISSADTAKIGPPVIARNVIHTPNPGDIVLMHDGAGHERTAQALPQILKELSAAGFQFVTVPELLRAWNEWLAAYPSAASGAPAAKPNASTPGKGRVHG
jgi:peptidoglycan/xylan/chitin deacetylase (PgdA/CDA1 family)